MVTNHRKCRRECRKRHPIYLFLKLKCIGCFAKYFDVFIYYLWIKGAFGQTPSARPNWSVSKRCRKCRRKWRKRHPIYLFLKLKCIGCFAKYFDVFIYYLWIKGAFGQTPSARPTWSVSKRCRKCRRKWRKRHLFIFS